MHQKPRPHFGNPKTGCYREMTVGLEVCHSLSRNPKTDCYREMTVCCVRGDHSLNGSQKNGCYREITVGLEVAIH